MDLKNELRKDEIFHDLTESLDQLVKHYRQLLELVRREKDILVAAKLEDLNENNKQKDAMLVRIRSIENGRMKSARDLALKLGADVEAPRLLDLAARLDGPRSEKLRTLHSALELLVKRASELNKQNEVLVQSALANISGAMESIRDSLQPKPTYAREARMSTAPAGGAGQLVSREA